MKTLHKPKCLEFNLPHQEMSELGAAHARLPVSSVDMRLALHAAPLESSHRLAFGRRILHAACPRLTEWTELWKFINDSSNCTALNSRPIGLLTTFYSSLAHTWIIRIGLYIIVSSIIRPMEFTWNGHTDGIDICSQNNCTDELHRFSSVGEMNYAAKIRHLHRSHWINRQVQTTWVIENPVAPSCE